MIILKYSYYCYLIIKILFLQSTMRNLSHGNYYIPFSFQPTVSLPQSDMPPKVGQLPPPCHCRVPPARELARSQMNVLSAQL